MALEVMGLICQIISAQLDLRHKTAVKTEHDVEIVIDFLIDDIAQVRKDLSHLAGNHPEHLVDEVDSPVIEHPAALIHEYMPVMHISVKAVESGLHDVEIAKLTGIKDILCRAEVHVKPPLLVDRKGDARFFARRFHLVEILEAQRDRFLAQNLLARFRRFDHKLFMLVVVGRDQDHFHFRIPDQVRSVLISLDPLRDVAQLLGIDVADRSDLNSVEVREHRLMLMSHEAVTDNAEFPCHVFSFLFCPLSLLFTPGSDDKVS